MDHDTTQRAAVRGVIRCRLARCPRRPHASPGVTLPGHGASARRWLDRLLLTVLLFAAPLSSAGLTALPDGVQAMSLDGRPLAAAPAGDDALDKLAAARRAYAADPDDVDNVIWLGRRTAYTGDYRGAIAIYSDGIARFPTDPRLYRHRGHRYISVREFDLAIADLLRAVVLMHPLPPSTEPDGLPNALNIPLTTTQGNVWYHLGLAYYLKRDWPLALAAFRNGHRLGGNDDNRVSTAHWMYMILRRMGDDAGAAAVLEGISGSMTIIENTSYHQLCLLYRGELAIDDMIDANGDDPGNAAVAYGIANYYYYNGDRARSDRLLRRIVAGASWSAFGFIAAEADLADPER